MENSSNIFSPVTLGRGTTPSKILGVVSQEKENERPTTPLESQSRKQKLDDHAPMGIKAKRMKKITEQLPDIGGVEDIMKMQEELNEQQTKVKTLEETATTYQKTVDDQQKELELLRTEKSTLSSQLNEECKSKEKLKSEIGMKTAAISTMEDEKQRLLRELEESNASLQLVQEEKQKQIEENNKQRMRCNLLDATLKESGAQFMIQQFRQKELTQQVVEQNNQTAKLQEEKDSLTTQLNNQTVDQNTKIHVLEEQIAGLKKEYFFAVALAIKLNISLYNINNAQKNIEIQSLYDTVQSQDVPTDKWSTWLVKQLDDHSNTKST